MHIYPVQMNAIILSLGSNTFTMLNCYYNITALFYKIYRWKYFTALRVITAKRDKVTIIYKMYLHAAVIRRRGPNFRVKKKRKKMSFFSLPEFIIPVYILARQ